MTAIVLSHETALDWWRRYGHGPAGEALGAGEAQAALASCRGKLHAALLKDVQRSPELCDLPVPLHVLSDTRGERRKTQLVHVHCMQTALPDGALIPVGRIADDIDLLVSSPAFCFVQMASQLGIWELAELGYELCGHYVHTEQASGQARHDVLATPQELRAFAETASNLTGAKPARRIAKSVLAGSRSLEQTHVALLAHLPRSLGGMGAKPPSLEQSISAPDVVARLIGSRSLSPDLYWPDARIALEYDGRPAGSTSTASDLAARKKSAYRMLGIEVILLDREQLDDLDGIEETFEHINRKCGTRLKPANGKQRARQEALLAWLREKRGAQQHTVRR